MLHKAWNSKGEMPFCFPRSSIKFQGHTVQNIADFDPNWAFPDYRPVAAFKSLRFALFFKGPINCKPELMQLMHRWKFSVSWFNTRLQWIGRRQQQDKTKNIQVLGFDVAYIRDLTAGTEVVSVIMIK